MCRDADRDPPVARAVERLKELHEEPYERGGEHDREQGDAPAEMQAAATSTPRRPWHPSLATNGMVPTAALEAGDAARAGRRLLVAVVVIAVEGEWLDRRVVVLELVVVEASATSDGTRGRDDGF